MWIIDFINNLFKGDQDKGPQQLNEAPRNNMGLEELTKEELDELGAQHGIKLDRRRRKATLIQQLNENNIYHK